MGKRFRFRDRPCVYCHGARLSTPTGDHVFARQFFVEKQRGNLPKVPACGECNAEKAQLEHYLTSMLPLGAHRQGANVDPGMAESRLAQNQRLRRELEEGREATPIRVAPASTRSITTVPFDGERLLSFFRFATKGLLWHHWEIMLGEAHDVFAGMIPVANEVALPPFFATGERPRVRGNLGSGTFHYEGSRHPEHPERSIWRFAIYGGVGMSAPDGEADHLLRTVVAITGDREFVGGLTASLRR